MVSQSLGCFLSNTCCTPCEGLERSSIYVGLSLVSCRGRLSPLAVSQLFHRIRGSFLTPIRGKLPSLFILRLAHCTCLFSTFNPSHLNDVGTYVSTDTLPPQLGFSTRVTAFRSLASYLPGKVVYFPWTPVPFTASAQYYSGFVVSGQLAEPLSLLWDSCSSDCRFAYGFLQIPPRYDALGFC